jgi:hypothetical protein
MLLTFLLQLLAFISPTHTFPYGRCYVPQCKHAPFQAQLTYSQQNQFCFQFQAKKCTPESYQCCEKFQKLTFKFVMPSIPVCNKSLDYVTLNTIRKPSSVFFDIYNSKAELRITALNMEGTRLMNTEFCVYLKPNSTCNTYKKFCRLSRNKAKCSAALFDPSEHDCCPHCRIKPI